MLYRPIKKPVTLRLDADVIAWFKKSGRGYQTRINRALRKMMEDEIKEEKKGSGEARANQQGVAGKRRQRLIRRVSVASGTDRKRLPIPLAGIMEAVDE